MKADKAAITFDIDKLQRMKEEKSVPDAVLENLRKRADVLLDTPTVSVVKRKLKAQSKNPHDYTSMGIYWWPNPDTEDGLPYVRRDGIYNPDCADDNNMGRLAEHISTLSAAAFYFDDERYARRAEQGLYDWFINPETYMEPNARYAQAIPGICDGRGVGLIDFATSYEIINGMCLLEAIDMLDSKVASGVRDWFVKFTDWMLTSEIGIDEDLACNNHGSWFDEQILCYALFTGRKSLAQKICTTAYNRRIKPQVQPDGSQPHELARTKGIHYSLYNMTAHSLIANMAKSMGYDSYWSEDAQLGKCLIKAEGDFIYPYVIDPESFPYKEISPKNVGGNMARLLMRLDVYFPKEGYAEKAAELMTDDMLWRVLPQG